MIREIVERNLVPLKDFVYGFADLTGLIDEKFDGHPYGISIGQKLSDKIVDGLCEGPTWEYWEHYNRVNEQLSKLTQHIGADLAAIDVDPIILEPTVSTEGKEFEKYLETLSVDISHKMVATRAGLGWIGKSDLFISSKFGPRLRLVSILIDQKIDSKFSPINKSKCGRCRICVEKCPANAANGKLWNIHVHRDEFFNAHKCRKKCGQLAKQRLNVDKRICGICVSVCPIGRKGKR